MTNLDEARAVLAIGSDDDTRFIYADLVWLFKRPASVGPALIRRWPTRQYSERIFVAFSSWAINGMTRLGRMPYY